MLLHQIFIYPIKSLGGISLKKSSVEKRGLSFDRRWMLVNSDGQFITQRENQKLALLQPEITSEHLIIKHRHNLLESLVLPLYVDASKRRRTVKVWKSICEANEVSDIANKWLSEAIGQTCQLVYMPDSTKRSINPKYSTNQEFVSFADGYPYLILGESSVADLNIRTTESVPMNRFRPNLVFSGGMPYEEDNWLKFQIGSVIFRATKPCVRCQITTIDQLSGNKHKEPLKTLAQYRRKGNEIFMGLNACWTFYENGQEENFLQIGDPLEVIERRETPFF